MIKINGKFYGVATSRLMKIKGEKNTARRTREKIRTVLKIYAETTVRALSYFLRDIELKIYVLYTPTVLNTFIGRTRASFNLPLTLKILRAF